eukprot:TRINITY_DN12879_c0_g1_i1.p2 TRINITY_DN12879_c0_g1~~TRINITY_DN12879_c0_g1_i1.p2  ORF type:complete len:242 (-),score=34.39 TRINITY_DN12879_c0_g1_i1:122-847(-)
MSTSLRCAYSRMVSPPTRNLVRPIYRTTHNKLLYPSVGQFYQNSVSVTMTPSATVQCVRRFFFRSFRTQEESVVDPLDDKIKDLEQRAKALNEMWKNSLHDVENVKQRMSKDLHKAQDFGVEKFVRNLFSVIDTLNICLQNKPDFNSPQFKHNSSARSAFESIETTKNQFCSVLKDSYGIEEVVPALGDNFDLTQHHALFEVEPPPDSSIEPGKIGLVVKSGWKRKDVLLRPASVGTVKQI